MTTKLIISSLVGIGALGSATFGVYFWLNNKESEKSRKTENGPDNKQTATVPINTETTMGPTASDPNPKPKTSVPQTEPSSAKLGQ